MALKARLRARQPLAAHARTVTEAMEYLGAHYFKRLTMIESLFGDTPHHLRRLDAAGGLAA